MIRAVQDGPTEETKARIGPIQEIRAQDGPIQEMAVRKKSYGDNISILAVELTDLAVRKHSEKLYFCEMAVLDSGLWRCWMVLAVTYQTSWGSGGDLPSPGWNQPD